MGVILSSNTETVWGLHCSKTIPMPLEVLYNEIMTSTVSSTRRFNKIAITNNKFQMASGQGSYWLNESPTNLSSMYSPPLSDICQLYF